MFTAASFGTNVSTASAAVMVEQLHTNVRQFTDSHTASHATWYDWLYLLDRCLIGIVGASTVLPSSPHLRGAEGVVKWQRENAEGGNMGRDIVLC